MVDARGWATASTTLLSLKSLCGGGVPSSHPSLGVPVFFLSFAIGMPTAKAEIVIVHTSCRCEHKHWISCVYLLNCSAYTYL